MKAAITKVEKQKPLSYLFPSSSSASNSHNIEITTPSPLPAASDGCEEEDLQTRFTLPY